MIAAFSWLTWISSVLLFASVQAASDSGNSSLRCTFAVNQLEFDLCPLVKAHSTAFNVVIDEETPPTHTKNIYAVSLGGALKIDRTLPAELQCPEGTWICLTVVNTRPNHPSEPSRILQVVPVASGTLNPTALLAKKVKDDDHHAPLWVTFHGGTYITRPQWATFIFHCDHAAEEPSKPWFIYKFNGTHAFSWTTKHACHKPLSKPQPEPAPDPPRYPPDDPETDPKKDIQIPPSYHAFLSWRFGLVVIILATARVLYVRYTASRRSYPRMVPPLTTRLTRMQLRPSLSTSLPFFRWSPYTLGKYISGGTPRTADNIFANYHDYEIEEEGEEVPLTPSPRGNLGHGTRGNGHYGSFE